jgi:hypothetical protein
MGAPDDERRPGPPTREWITACHRSPGPAADVDCGYVEALMSKDRLAPVTHMLVWSAT